MNRIEHQRKLTADGLNFPYIINFRHVFKAMSVCVTAENDGGRGAYTCKNFTSRAEGEFTYACKMPSMNDILQSINNKEVEFHQHE